MGSKMLKSIIPHNPKIFPGIFFNRKWKIRGWFGGERKRRCLKYFLLSYLVYSQIWLNLLMDDCHYSCCITKFNKISIFWIICKYFQIFFSKITQIIIQIIVQFFRLKSLNFLYHLYKKNLRGSVSVFGIFLHLGNKRKASMTRYKGFFLKKEKRPKVDTLGGEKIELMIFQQ